GMYADILSMMTSADIDAAVNAIETIGKKFQVDVSKSSPLVSPSTTINVPCKLNSIDVAATFKVPLSTVGDLHKLINDIEAGKHDELLSGMTNDDRMETLDALDDSINLNVDESTIPSDHIVQSVDINTKSTSYAGAAGASAKDQQKLILTFVPWWLLQYLMMLTSLFLVKLSKRLVLALNTLYMATLLEREWRFWWLNTMPGTTG
ncbi:hypothetical protein Tco_0037250, partial [Tanacetum coccineum]